MLVSITMDRGHCRNREERQLSWQAQDKIQQKDVGRNQTDPKITAGQQPPGSYFGSQ